MKFYYRACNDIHDTQIQASTLSMCIEKVMSHYDHCVLKYFPKFGEYMNYPGKQECQIYENFYNCRSGAVSEICEERYKTFIGNLHKDSYILTEKFCSSAVDNINSLFLLGFITILFFVIFKFRC